MKKIKFYTPTILLLFLTLLITSCGFRFQGEMQLAPPLKRMYLQTPDPYGILARNLQQFLKVSHVMLVPSPTIADTILVILQDANSQQLVSVSSTQQTRQYNLIVSVTFEITDANGKVLLPPQGLNEVRTITVQSNQILGSSNEANLFYQQMRRNLAQAIMNRLASHEVTRLVTGLTH